MHLINELERKHVVFAFDISNVTNQIRKATQKLDFETFINLLKR